MSYWLMKSEPGEFSIDDLHKSPNKTERWDGVRNYQARNMIRDQMKVGDLAFFYHSSCETPGIAGIMKVVSEPFPDETAFSPAERHYDPKSDPSNPRWYCIDMQFVRRLRRLVTLRELRSQRELEQLPLVRRGNRLSIMPVSRSEWDYILALEEQAESKPR